MRTDEFLRDFQGEMLRSRMIRKKKAVAVQKPVIVPASQQRLVRTITAAEIKRDSIYERNKRLAEEAARADMEAYSRRQSWRTR